MNQQFFVGSIDQSTSSTKLSIFKINGQLVVQSILQHKQISLKNGWLEHDPNQILKNLNIASQNIIEAFQKKGYRRQQIKGFGVCNQRQTIVAWDSQSGKSLYNAIVWCDARTAGIAQDFKKKFGQFKQKVGLPISSYFSLFKILWLLQNVKQVKQKFDQGKIRFGTIDSWVTYNLTGKFVTDASNASRTYLYNLKGYWDQQLITLVGLKKQFLPEVVGSFTNIGGIKQGVLKDIPICCILGDQQSSAYALNLKKNEMKNSYGTGCFMMMNIGQEPKIYADFVTTILHKDKQIIQYAIEASIQCGGGTINWLKSINLFSEYNELNKLDNNSQGVLFYPTFGSIYSPFWKNNVSGAFFGLTLYSTRQHMLRAALQSIAFRVYDNINSKQIQQIKAYKVDGGLTMNPILMQTQANLIKKNVTVCKLDTCWGVAKGVIRALNLKQEQEIDNVVMVYKFDESKHNEISSVYKIWQANRHKSFN